MNHPRRPSRKPPTPDDWDSISEWGRWNIAVYCWLSLHRPIGPVLFSFFTGMVTLSMLNWLPAHPMNLPISVGTGLSISILARGLSK